MRKLLLATLVLGALLCSGKAPKAAAPDPKAEAQAEAAGKKVMEKKRESLLREYQAKKRAAGAAAAETVVSEEAAVEPLAAEAAPQEATEKAPAKKAAKAKPATKKAVDTAKAQKKVMKQKREELFESLEEKVFRAPNNSAAELAAGEKAFETGKKRMYYLNREEAEIKEYSQDLKGGEAPDNYPLLGDRFDETRDEFLTKKGEIEALDKEYEVLQKYLSKLEAMEKRAVKK